MEISHKKESTPDDISIIDGTLLADLWDNLVLPRDVRSAWNPVIRGELVRAV